MKQSAQNDPTALAITALRKAMGRRLLILGHYYQRDEVLRHADLVGDSFELARWAAAAAAERIVFCGVHFMAESAEILSSDKQAVFMPDINAGCPMADMAPLGAVEKAWHDLQTWGADWLPVVYINSSAALKAFCGKNGGYVCTSSNASQAFQQALVQNKRVLFIPDEHLGANTAHDLNLPETGLGVYDSSRPAGGVAPASRARIQILVWRGYCHVHMFTVADLARARQQYPDAKIIVHPETPSATTRLADAHGSTSQIIRYVESQPRGATIVVGTELHLVERLARQQRGQRTIVPLRPATCHNMSLTTAAKLLSLLQNWPPANQVQVAPALRDQARLALSRMLSL